MEGGDKRENVKRVAPVEDILWAPLRLRAWCICRGLTAEQEAEDGAREGSTEGDVCEGS